MEIGTTNTATDTNRDWKSPKGINFSVFQLEIEQDGKVLFGTTLVKDGTECKFKKGQEAKFTKELDTYTNDGTYKFKWASEQKGWGGGKGREPENPKIRNISFAMSYCHDIYVARLQKTLVSEPMTLDGMFELTSKMIKFMNDKIDLINNK